MAPAARIVLLAGFTAMAGSFCGSLEGSLVTWVFCPMTGLVVVVLVCVEGFGGGGIERFGMLVMDGGCWSGWAGWEGLANVVGVRRMIVKSRIVAVRRFVKPHVSLGLRTVHD